MPQASQPQHGIAASEAVQGENNRSAGELDSHERIRVLRARELGLPADTTLVEIMAHVSMLDRKRKNSD